IPFAATSGAPQTADKLGRSSHPTEAHTAAIRNGSPLTGPPPAWATVFNISFGPNSPLASSEDSVARRTPERHGRLRLVFLTRLSGVRLTSPAMAIFSSAAGIQVAASGAFGRPTRRTRLLRPRLTRSQQ